MSENLQLPFGEVKVLIDNVNIEYTWENVEKDRTCPNLDGRYKLQINFKPDEKHHTISCIIDSQYSQARIDYVEQQEYTCIEELEQAIIEYIDYYNNKRIKSKLNGMSPVQYREHSQKIA